MKDVEIYPGIPESVRIGQREYRVVIRRKDSDPTLHKALGYTMLQGDCIVLRDCMSLAFCRSTLLHEIMHAIMSVFSNDYNDEVFKKNKGADMDDMAHYFINALEEPMVMVLIDNKKLVKFLSNRV